MNMFSRVYLLLCVFFVSNLFCVPDGFQLVSGDCITERLRSIKDGDENSAGRKFLERNEYNVPLINAIAYSEDKVDEGLFQQALMKCKKKDLLLINKEDGKVSGVLVHRMEGYTDTILHYLACNENWLLINTILEVLKEKGLSYEEWDALAKYNDGYGISIYAMISEFSSGQSHLSLIRSNVNFLFKQMLFALDSRQQQSVCCSIQ